MGDYYFTPGFARPGIQEPIRVFGRAGLTTSLVDRMCPISRIELCWVGYNFLAMPILDKRTFEFFSKSPEQTRRLGKRLGSLLQPGDLICLQGDLGAGKTTLVQGVASGWGAQDEVSSPTFVLVNAYRRRDGSQLSHFDAYRVESLGEAEELDLEALLDAGPLFVEWPERVEPILPGERLWTLLEYEAEEHRTIRFTANGKHYEDLLDNLRQIVYGVD